MWSKYRPMANLSELSKLLERLVARQLLDYLSAPRLLLKLQSAYRAFHSTETAVTKVLADVLMALDGGDIAALAPLDLSATFNTVDHGTTAWMCRWHSGPSPGVVCVVPRQPHSVRSLRWIHLDGWFGYVWSSTRIGSRSDTIPVLRGGSTAID